MKKLLLICSLVFFGTSVFANEITLNTKQSLTKEQEAQLATEAAKMASDNVSNVNQPEKTVATVKSWVDIGSAIGSGLAASAKELGIAANEFANTGVGKVTVFLIVWHFFGNEVVHMMFGSLWLLIGIILWVYFYRRLGFVTEVTTYEVGKGPNGIKKQVIRRPVNIGEGTSVCLIMSLMTIAAVGVFAFFTY